MKIETRKVLVEQEVYIASDGTEFDDESECEAYELQIVEKQMLFFDSKFKRTTVRHCMYAVLRTDEEVKQIKRMCELWRFVDKGLDKTGVYYWADCWINLSEIMENIEREIRNEQKTTH